jgi:hypothetical protein
VVFASEAELKEHYRSEWHRHNLKRKVAGLAPIGKQDYESRLAALKAQQETNAGGKKIRQKKQQGTDERKKHPQSKAAAGEKRAQMTDEEFIESKLDAATTYMSTMSLFDRQISDSTESNLEYMRKNFGFRLPYSEYVSDVEGLLMYLGEKVYAGNFSLLSGKQFHSVEAVQQHMVQKGQCCFDITDISEYAPFYNLVEMVRDDILVLEEPDSDDEDDEDDVGEWETDDEGNEEEDTVMAEAAASISGAAVKKQKNYVWARFKMDQRLEEVNEGFQLGVEGKTIGHREFKLYYKQQPKPSDDRESVVANKGRCELIAAGGKIYYITNGGMGDRLGRSGQFERDKVATQNAQLASLKLGAKKRWEYRKNAMVSNSGR